MSYMSYEHKERRRQWVYEYGKFNNDYGRTNPKTPILTDIRQVDEIIKNIYNRTGEKIDTKIPKTDSSYTRIHIYQENKTTEGGATFDLFFVNTENSIPVIVFGIMPPGYLLDESVKTAIVLSSLGIDPNNNRDCEPCFKIYNYGHIPIIPLTSYNLEKAILDMLYGEEDERNYLRDLRPLFKHNNIKKY